MYIWGFQNRKLTLQRGGLQDPDEMAMIYKYKLPMCKMSFQVWWHSLWCLHPLFCKLLRSLLEQWIPKLWTFHHQDQLFDQQQKYRISHPKTRIIKRDIPYSHITYQICPQFSKKFFRKFSENLKMFRFTPRIDLNFRHNINVLNWNYFIKRIISCFTQITWCNRHTANSFRKWWQCFGARWTNFSSFTNAGCKSEWQTIRSFVDRKGC